MIRLLVPRFSCGRWGGGTDDGLGDVAGFYITIEWFGLMTEFCIGRVRR